MCCLILDFLEQLLVDCDVVAFVDQLRRVNLDILVRLLYIRDYLVNFLRLVLFLLPYQLLLSDQVILFAPESFNLIGGLLLHVGDLLPLDGDVVALLMLDLLQLGEVPHEPIVLVLVELELLLLRLARALPLLQLHRVLVHRVAVQKLLAARHADLTASFTRRVVHRVGTRLVEAGATV